MISKKLVAGMIVVTATVAGTVQADVLYNTLGTFNTATQSFIGGWADNVTQFSDDQRADDFVVPAGPGYLITSVSADFMTASPFGFQAPAHGVLVEFFASVGSAPSAVASFAVLTQNFSLAALDISGIPTATGGGRFIIDLSGEGIDLGEGTWWIGIQPVDLSETGIRYNWARQSGTPIGNQTHRRNGGEAHGNGFPGGSGSPNWNISPASNGTLAMAVEGTLIPAPAGLTLLAIAGLMGRRRRR